MIKKLIFLQLLALILLAYTAKAQYVIPSDSLATTETRWMLGSMQRLLGAGVLFGHHDDTAYGVGWRLKDSSDVNKVTGALPAVYGWDLSGIELDSLWDINHVPFTTQARLVREAYERGGINTFCWHMNNPVSLKTSWDTSAVNLIQLLPGGEYHAKYKTWLDRAAKYLESLKGRDGEPIPILFRPFHELTGTWFWWGMNNGYPDDFVALWRFTVDYLRKEKKLHNLIIVYSVADFYSEDDLMIRYPGNEYVDVLGFDKYCFQDFAVFKENMVRQLDIVTRVALNNHKLACISETGYQGIPQANWWTNVLAPILAPYNTKLSYMMLWRNNGAEHFYTPYPGQASATDFKEFYKSNTVSFQDKITPLGVYGSRHMLRYNRNVEQQ